jgi:CysZ protein
MPRKNNAFNGLNYLTRGAELIVKPQLRWFVLVPLMINLVLFFIATSFLIQQFGVAMEWLLDWLPGWLEFLAWIAWVIFAGLVLLIYGYSFSLITNLLAAPFYGILAEKTELLVRGEGPAPESLSSMIPRTIRRELIKLWYFITRGLAIALVMLVLSFIPLVNVLVPLIGFIWGAWSMAIQYTDYPADNHQLAFTESRARLGQQKYSSLSLGSLVMLGTMIPIANIFVMPIAVVASTLFWIDELEQPGDPA